MRMAVAGGTFMLCQRVNAQCLKSCKVKLAIPAAFIAFCSARRSCIGSISCPLHVNTSPSVFGSFLYSASSSGVTSGEFEYVQRVVDRDTLLLGTGERVRLIGVNTPETVHPQKPVEAFGKEASAFTKRMVEGKLVRLEFDPVSSRRNDGKDRYSRTLAYVFLQDGTHLNVEIIRQGYGFAVSSSPPLKYRNEFRQLEGEAREQRRGLWASH
jgi:micrococcal nuclease